jgi:hypothetical protein
LTQCVNVVVWTYGAPTGSAGGDSPLAQSVEQRTCKQGVPGSKPRRGKQLLKPVSVTLIQGVKGFERENVKGHFN